MALLPCVGVRAACQTLAASNEKVAASNEKVWELLKSSKLSGH
jgi:hypothetical protein